LEQQPSQRSKAVYARLADSQKNTTQKLGLVFFFVFMMGLSSLLAQAAALRFRVR
jgi:hypothetical protein